MSFIRTTNKLKNFYIYLFDELGGNFSLNPRSNHVSKMNKLTVLDPRTKDWFLVPSPLPGIAVILLYLYFVLVLGPKIMKHRKPYDLRTVLKLYNFLQILYSCYLFYMVRIYLHLSFYKVTVEFFYNLEYQYIFY